jgi:hypothetical protein
MASLSLTSPRIRHDAAHALVACAGAFATAILIACGARIALAATADATYLVPSGRRSGYPRWMRGPLAGHGHALHLHAFVALTLVMVAAYVCVLMCARRMPAWLLASGILVATLVFTLAPPLLSTDVFNYIAYGQMGTNGINPYLHGPAVLAGEPLYAYTGHLWKDVPSAYGPFFTLLTYALAPLGTATAFWALKALSGACVLALAALAAMTARRLGHDPRFAAAFVALNPLVLVFALGGAHNDLLMAVPLAAAIYLAVANRPAAAGTAAVSAIAIKASAGLALPFVLLGARPRRRALAGAVAAAIVVVGVSLLVFGSAIAKMAGALAMQQRFHWIVVSIPGFVGHYAGVGVPGHTARTALAALAAAALVTLVVRARGGRGWIEGAAAATLVVLATTAWVLPWYVLWALPFAALVKSRTLRAAALVVSVLLISMQLDHFLLTHASHHPHARARTARRL